MEWTDESIARLKALWAEGLSTAEIGRRMGVSKNAVVGKAHRLLLASRPSPIRRDTDGTRAARGTVPRRVTGPTLPSLAMDPVPFAPDLLGPALHGARPDASSAPGLVPLSPGLPHPANSGPAASGAATSNPGASGPAASSLAASGPAPNQAARPAAPRPAPLALAPRPIGSERRRTLACCWPIGEPGTRSFRFCNEDSAGGKPYCAAHAALAYVRVRDRREDAA